MWFSVPADTAHRGGEGMQTSLPSSQGLDQGRQSKGLSNKGMLTLASAIDAGVWPPCQDHP